jgi:hypothetical protein
MFKFSSFHSHEHGLPAFLILFSFVPILLPPNPTLSFFTGESASILSFHLLLFLLLIHYYYYHHGCQGGTN